MKKLIQRVIARIFNSQYFFENPYLDYRRVENQLDVVKIKRCVNQVTMGKDSKFYSQAEVFNIQNDKSKIVVGENTHIRGVLLIFGNGGEIKVGNDSYIGEGTQIWSSEKVKIGNSVLISHNCNIIDNNSHEEDFIERHDSFVRMLKKGHSKDKQNIKSGPIIIEDNVWISFNVTIMKGVKIGRGAIIGAGSIITKDIEPFSVVVGNPPKIVKQLNE